MADSEKPWSCYCLVSDSGSTYVGASVDVDRRLRQHKGELSGGAYATKRGTGWRRACHVVGFPDSRSALQFEWRWKQLSRKEPSKNPMERRIRGLCALVNLDKATSAAKPFSEFDGPLQIHLELPQYKSFFEGVVLANGVLMEN